MKLARCDACSTSAILTTRCHRRKTWKVTVLRCPRRIVCTKAQLRRAHQCQHLFTIARRNPIRRCSRKTTRLSKHKTGPPVATYEGTMAYRPRHMLSLRTGVDLLRRAYLCNLTFMHHRYTVRCQERRLSIVSDQDRCHIRLLDDTPNLTTQPVDQTRIKIRERLIHQYGHIVRRNRPRNRHALLLTA